MHFRNQRSILREGSAAKSGGIMHGGKIENYGTSDTFSSVTGFQRVHTNGVIVSFLYENEAALDAQCVRDAVREVMAARAGRGCNTNRSA
jgi:hypothetical protein